MGIFDSRFLWTWKTKSVSSLPIVNGNFNKMILQSMSLLSFVNTYKIRNYSYIKGRSLCPFTSHEILWNNFSFHSNKGIHHMHYIWYGGDEYLTRTTFFIIIGPVNPQIFFLNWLRNGKCQQLFLFWCSWWSIW